MDRVTEILKSYLKELDENIEKLSNRFEGNLAGIPSWILNNRKVIIGHIPNKNFYIIKIIPESDFEEDVFEYQVINDDFAYQNLMEPWQSDQKIKNLPTHSYNQRYGDIKLIETNNINAVPAFHDKNNYTFITADMIPSEFSFESAKKAAFDFWNNAQNKLPDNVSFVDNLQIIFDRFRSIIKRKAFLERRIHRYINEYSTYLLPSHTEKYFEHPLYLNGDKRVADFILQRESGFPSMLIELESPHLNMFRKNAEPTSEANHAKNQIAEWVRYIDRNHENAHGKFEFLSGPKERLVIMGRGLEFTEEMINSKFTDTLMWTYDFMMVQAKEKWNRFIIDQCRLLGIQEPNLIK